MLDQAILTDVIDPFVQSGRRAKRRGNLGEGPIKGKGRTKENRCSSNGEA